MSLSYPNATDKSFATPLPRRLNASPALRLGVFMNFYAASVATLWRTAMRAPDLPPCSGLTPGAPVAIDPARQDVDERRKKVDEKAARRADERDCDGKEKE